MSTKGSPIAGTCARPPADVASASAGSHYETYIHSAAWRDNAARHEELALSGGLCRLCARGAPKVRIEVHHNRYDRLGRERTRDLCTLCHECHPIVTAELRRRRYASTTLPGLRDTPRMLAERILNDTSAGR